MSFCIDLWNGIEPIKNEITSIQKKLKMINNLLTSYVNLEKEYAKSLENFYKENKDPNEKIENLIDESYNLFLESFRIESEKHKNHSHYIVKNIIGEIKVKLDTSKSLVLENFTNYNQSKENINKLMNDFSLNQQTYNNSCKELCLCISEIEFNNIRNITSDGALVSNLKNLMEKLNQTKNDYFTYIYYFNNVIDNFNVKTENILNSLEKFFKSNACLFQNVVTNFISNKITTLNDILTINKENLEKTFSKLNFNNETYEFIVKNATKEFPMCRLEYIPYKLNLANSQIMNKFSNENLSKEEYNKILKCVSKFFDDSKILNVNEENITYIKSVNKEHKKVMNKKVTDSILNRKFYNFFNKRKSKETAADNNNINSPDTKNNPPKNSNLISIISEVIDPNLPINNPKSKHLDINQNTSLNISDDGSNNQLLIKEKNEKIKNNIILIKKFFDEIVLNTININNNKLNEINNNSNINTNNENETNNFTMEDFISLISKNNPMHMMYIETYLKDLNTHRAKGNFILTEDSYEKIIHTFNFFLENFNTNYFILKNVIILSQTFYKIVDENKIYIISGIKNNPTLNKVETWHRVINYSLSHHINSGNLTNKINKEDFNKKLDLIAANNLVSYLCDIKLATDNENVFDDVKKFYCRIYKIDNNSIDEQISDYYKELEKYKNKKSKDKPKPKEKNEKNKENKNENDKNKENENDKNKENKDEIKENSNKIESGYNNLEKTDNIENKDGIQKNMNTENNENDNKITNNEEKVVNKND